MASRKRPMGEALPLTKRAPGALCELHFPPCACSKFTRAGFCLATRGGSFPGRMAACAAGRRAWSWTGVAPLLAGLCRQIHRTPVPLTCLRLEAPFAPRVRPRRSYPVFLLRPASRCQSTAAVAGTQVVQAAASPPAEGTVSAGELGQAVQELSFEELGLGAYTPVGLIQNILESLHVDLGLPWWGAIVAGTVVARCLIFPLIVKGQREAVKLNNHLPQINQLTSRLNEAKRMGNKFEFAKAYSDLALYQKTHDVNPLRGFLVPLVQAPIFISFFIALRKMAELPVPSLQTGGLWWFMDLTAADPYYVLPLTVTATMWAILELGAESGVSNPNLQMMKTVFRVMPLIILPLTISFPTAIFTYWLTSNVFSLVQVGVLRVPAVRARLRIPDRVVHDPSVLPAQEGFVKSLKKGWKNAQLAQQLEERERRIKHHLDLAAKGPLRQTFPHNPLQQHEPSVTKPKPPKRPWEDTLG
ncbi:mitochondrial inner membrane protein OXA1L [Hemicordylus capensis]|uniref:mitochondrial inner membrane protein OXA1L n=1 Tax=Hemicordylus capensis TaxID=884348 RepID=UPI002302BA00|nr:mitochondrial inner membrane protein OXA1L [Hemicordylus capensis]